MLVKALTKSVSICLLTLGLSVSTHANNLYMDLSSDSVHLRGDAAHSSTDLLYFASAHITEDKGEAISLGLLKTGQIGNNASLFGGIGAKAYVIDSESDTVFAAALGGQLSYEIKEVEGLSITSEIFYAPSITISDDLDKLVDVQVRAHYALFENGEIYGGLRQYKFEADNGASYSFDKGPFVGIKISF